MKIKDLQKDLAELLIFIAEYYPDLEQDVDSDLLIKIWNIYSEAE